MKRLFCAVLCALLLTGCLLLLPAGFLLLALPALLKAVDGAESSHRNPLGLPYASLEYSAPPAGLLWAFGVAGGVQGA